LARPHGTARSWGDERVTLILESSRVVELPHAPEPAEACARFLRSPYCLLLDSAARSGRLGRYSFLTADPFLVIRSKNGEIQLQGEGRTRTLTGDPFAVLRDVLARYAAEPIVGLPPFQGGAAGFWAYDLCHHLERLPSPRHDDLALPDLCIGVYDWVLAWDHETARTWLVSTGQPEPVGPARETRAAERAREVRMRLAGPPAAPLLPSPGPPAHPTESAPTYPVPQVPGVRSTFTRPAYLRAVARTREYILAGDIFQANLSHRLQAPLADDPWSLYLRLRRHNRAPFAAYFDLGEAAILSSSPERFVRLDGDRVETRPIKGTMPRGTSPEHDLLLREALRASEKDRSENVMIVDLLRNDLSIVCRDGSVTVPELCVVESYATVHHLVSTVVGRLRPGLDAVDVLRATFPGGSITGAPKVRAMEIIAELEPTRRNVYTGAIGYLGFDGSMDTAIAIRTLIVKDRQAYFGVGGGIVADSDPEREYQETIHKASGLLAALGP
jgi:para-aminobenzoate synthetase component I